VRILLALKQRHLINVHVGLYIAVQQRKENVAKLLLKNKARFGKLSAYSTGEKAFIRYLQIPRQNVAANVIQNWWIPICYDMNRACGKRMFEKNYEAYKIELQKLESKLI
jgi:hypothetical protein